MILLPSPLAFVGVERLSRQEIFHGEKNERDFWTKLLLTVQRRSLLWTRSFRSTWLIQNGKPVAGYPRQIMKKPATGLNCSMRCHAVTRPRWNELHCFAAAWETVNTWWLHYVTVAKKHIKGSMTHTANNRPTPECLVDKCIRLQR